MKSKEEEYKAKIQELSLQISYLKVTSEENELLLKESIEREMILEDKIVVLDQKILEGEKEREVQKLKIVEKLTEEFKEK